MTKPKTRHQSNPLPPIPKRGSHLVVAFPDLHVPYHDEEALAVALHTIETLKPAKTVILGDFIDCASMSQFPPKALVEIRAHDFNEDEIIPANGVLDKIQKYSGETIYLEGNHEARVEKVAAQMGGPFAAAYSLISPRKLLSADRKNFTWIPYNAPLPHYRLANDLIAMHGISTAKHFAASNLGALRSVSSICGHVHRQQSTSTRDPMTGRVIKAWSPGCLSKLQPVYMHHNPSEWVHALELIFIRDDLSAWTNYTVTIQDGECILPTGKTVKA